MPLSYFVVIETPSKNVFPINNKNITFFFEILKRLKAHSYTIV